MTTVSCQADFCGLGDSMRFRLAMEAPIGSCQARARLARWGNWSPEKIQGVPAHSLGCSLRAALYPAPTGNRRQLAGIHKLIVT